MSLVVQKSGGSSVADADHSRNVASIITKTYSQNDDVVAVVPAQGDTTDNLVAKAKEMNPCSPKREMDMLLTAGEQVFVSLFAMAIERMGFPVVSLLGWQAGFLTDMSYGSARIKRVTPGRTRKELDEHNIATVTGFQEINRYNDMTILGRDGSGTSAVAIAAVIHADLCQIYTDVEGVYTADPRKIKNAKKIDVIPYGEALELATFGAQVLNSRSVEMAEKHNIELEALSDYSRVPGTVVKEATEMEKTLTSDTAKDDGMVHIVIIGVPDRPGPTFKVFSKLSAKNVNVDIILQPIGCNGIKDISFTVSEDHLQATMGVLTPYVEQISASSVVYDEDVAKVSIVDAGMEIHSGVAAMVFKALFGSNISIQMISTSETKISVLIERKDVDKVVVAIHSKFFPEIIDQ